MVSAAVLVELWRAPAPGRPTLSSSSPHYLIVYPTAQSKLAISSTWSRHICVCIYGRIPTISIAFATSESAVCPTPTITLGLFFRVADES